ncbi:MAG: TraM recognition domain-containing protein [Bdellovibrionota bacterium]
MFYDSKKVSNESQSENHGPFAFGAVLVVLCAAGPKIWARFLIFHRVNFAEIYFCIFLLFLGFAIYRLITLRKKHAWIIGKISKIKSLTQNWAGGVLVGHAEGVPLHLPNHLRLEHVQIVGATGRGKTKSVVVPWVVNDFKHDKKVILIDGKGDLSLRDDLYAEIGNWWREVIHFNMDDVNLLSTTNPLRYGSPQQITDRVFSSFDFEDPFYRGLQYDICLKVVRLLHEIEGEVTFKVLYQCLVDDEYFAEKIKSSNKEALRSELERFINQPRKERSQNLMGLITQVGPFATGELCDLVNGVIEGKEFMSVSELLLNSPGYKMILISLPTLSYQAAGKALGKMLLQELAWAIGERQQGLERDFTSVFLDEFSSFAYDEFVQILNKARSAGVAIHLSHQSMGDLWSVSKEFGDIVNTNTNVKILLGLNDPEAADYFASHIGTRTTEKLTERAQDKGFWGKRMDKTGELSIREVEEYIIHPNNLKSLAPGEGVIVTRTSEGILATEVKFPNLKGVA